jgi:hypothetical protein
MQPWGGRVLLNPPGGLVNEFWAKVLDERGNFDQLVWIGYSLEQLQSLQAAFNLTPLDFPICFTKRRIAFIENEARKAFRITKLLEKGEAPGVSDGARKRATSIRAGKEPPNSPSHSNYIAYLGPDGGDFARVFSAFGKVRA